MTNTTNAAADIDLLALFAEAEAELAADPTLAARLDVFYGCAAERERQSREAAVAMARTEDPCGKCRGTGHIHEFRHISGGDCFDCAGSGHRYGNL